MSRFFWLHQAENIFLTGKLAKDVIVIKLVLTLVSICIEDMNLVYI
jgi:hypothetical protein